MAEYSTVELVAGRGFLEGPRWHAGLLWISDLHRHEVLTVTPAGETSVALSLADQPSGLGFLPDGTPLVVSVFERKLLRIEGGYPVLHADLASLTRGGANDMVVDSHGRAYIGSFGYDYFSGEPAAPGNIVRIDPDGSAAVVAAELEFPNGMVIVPGGRTLVVAETQGNRLTAFDILPDGSLSGRRVFAPLDDEPDGICQDAEGGIWVSYPRGKRFVRVLEGGEVTDSIAVPGRRAVACALGGPGGKTFFAATSKFWRDATGTVVGESWIETAAVAVPGVP